MSPSTRLQPDSPAHKLVEEVRLGTLVTASENRGLQTFLSPFTFFRSAAGTGMLLSHAPRSSALMDDIDIAANCSVTFLGAHGYISSSWLDPVRRNSAPTWNFTVATIRGRLQALTDREFDQHLHDLVEDLEDGRPDRWYLHEMGERYEKLAQRIRGFAVAIDTVEVRTKLGQADDPRDMSAVVQALAAGSHSDRFLAEAMTSFAGAGTGHLSFPVNPKDDQ